MKNATNTQKEWKENCPGLQFVFEYNIFLIFIWIENFSNFGFVFGFEWRELKIIFFLLFDCERT